MKKLLSLLGIDDDYGTDVPIPAWLLVRDIDSNPVIAAIDPCLTLSVLGSNRYTLTVSGYDDQNCLKTGPRRFEVTYGFKSSLPRGAVLEAFENCTEVGVFQINDLACMKVRKGNNRCIVKYTVPVSYHCYWQRESSFAETLTAAAFRRNDGVRTIRFSQPVSAVVKQDEDSPMIAS